MRHRSLILYPITYIDIILLDVVEYNLYKEYKYLRQFQNILKIAENLFTVIIQSNVLHICNTNINMQIIVNFNLQTRGKHQLYFLQFIFY